jgi:CRISPR-associated protein Cas1
MGYTYLFNFMESLLTLYGFDVYRGVYHRAFYQRKSLVCDLVEPFRCIIDRKVRAAYNLKQLQADHFQQIQGRYLLLPEHNKTYTRWLLESILERKTELFQYVQDYYRCFMRSRPAESYPQFFIEKP